MLIPVFKESENLTKVFLEFQFQSADFDFTNKDEYQLIDSLDVSNEVVENTWEIENENYEAEDITYVGEVDMSTVKEEDSSDIPMTYIDENNVEESIIILTKEEVEGLNLDDSQQIIVSTK
ncbi:Protein of unknown function [Cotesia congregata]|uniref:Uncharacterized protein n=1 Tax=Cotesia congregata TaxID=51543 RepID=A0A8J2H786_COTCN|nr:Protein of unknown function [Cotesia congregata]